MKLDKLLDILLLTGSVLLFFTIPAQSQEIKGRNLQQVRISTSTSGNRSSTMSHPVLPSRLQKH